MSRPTAGEEAASTTGIAGAEPATVAELQHRPKGFWSRFRRNRLGVFALIWLSLLLACFLVPGLLATHDPARQDVTLVRLLETPSGDHWLGTDAFGRDLYSRVVWGGRLAVQAILISLGISAGIGIPVGLFSGWKGGRVDRAIMWVVDVLFSLPLILLALAIVAALGTGMVPAMIAVGILLSTRFARLTRGVTLAEREELYVDAARITGLSTPTILRRYILPNLLPTLIVQVAIISGVILLISAVLSFIGIGSAPDSYDWGAMLNQARREMLTDTWQLVPSVLAVVLTVLAFNLVGDAVRDAIGRDTSTNVLSRTSRVGIAAAETAHAHDATLSIRDITVEFPAGAKGAVNRILDRVSIEVRPAETLGLVGESGSGKSMTAFTALGLTPAPGRLVQGSIRFDGRDVTAIREREWQRIRGLEIGMIFQEPVAALNPGLTIGAHLMEPLQVHLGLRRRSARNRAADLLGMVHVPDPLRRLDEYPHQFSGGMAQRVGIAMALACEPKLLIADEPTTALDVTVQGQVLDLLQEIQERLQMAMILITHDLGVVAEAADRVAVMYAGQIVETATVNELFFSPRHPYTQALLATMPQSHTSRDTDLAVIPGMVPPPSAWPAGCRFHPRCAHAVDRCRAEAPEAEIHPDGRMSRCLRSDEIEWQVALAGEPEPPT